MAPDKIGRTLSAGHVWRPAWAGLLGGLVALAGCDGGLWFDPAAGLLSAKDTVRAGALAVADNVATYDAELAGGADYELVDLGPSVAGDRWTVFAEYGSVPNDAIVIVLLDADWALQCRGRVAIGDPVQSTLRHDTDHLYAGVQTAHAASLTLVAARRHEAVPAPQAQLVWLNFDGAASVQINAQPMISFGPFDAVDVNPAYAGQTALMMAEIARTVRDLYADFDVTILTSAEVPEPAEAHSTIYFGGDNAQYLGMGEAVDGGNADASDPAIVYTQTFARYSTMHLEPEEMARMIGNAAGHELGHLLGLCHVRGAQNVMDETRSAWELAGESVVAAGSLADTVFPIGIEDAPTVLAETVGVAPSR